MGAGFAEGLERSASASVRATGAKRIRQSLPPTSARTSSRLLRRELAIPRPPSCNCELGGVLWDSSEWGSWKGLYTEKASWRWCGRGRFRGSLAYWGNLRPSGLLLLSIPPGRRDGRWNAEFWVLSTWWWLVVARTHLCSRRAVPRVGQGPLGGVTLVRPGSRDPTFWSQL